MTESSAASPPSDLNARYGRSGRSRRPLLIGVAGVIALAGLAWLIWVAWVQSNPPVTSQLQGFEIVSPTSVKATVKVDRSKSVAANCRLQAKAADFSIVGEVTLTVPAAREQVLRKHLKVGETALVAALKKYDGPG